MTNINRDFEQNEYEKKSEQDEKTEQKRNDIPSGTATLSHEAQHKTAEGRPVERRTGARGTAAMDPQTRQEVARKGGLAVSRNKEHMAEIGRKGGQSVSRNRDHMAQIGRKGGSASRTKTSQQS
jgi:general stress protein YciG